MQKRKVNYRFDKKTKVVTTMFIWLVFSWSKLLPVLAQESVVPTGAFLGEYFDNSDLTSLVFTRTDNEINFDWGKESPSLSIDNDTFSVRWRGNFFFEDGTYEFFVKADDGVRLFVDGVAIINEWEAERVKEYRVAKNMTAGAHQVKIEYFENEKNASVKAGWVILGLVDGEEIVEPTPSLPPGRRPTPTPTQALELQNGGESVGGDTPEVLVANETDELPETGLSDQPFLWAVALFGIFGTYLFKRFKLEN